MNKPAENKMGVMPENKLLLNMAVPMMLSMLVQALYNIVDSIFVSKLSQDALNAVSLAFPMQNLMIAVGAGTAVQQELFGQGSLTGVGVRDDGECPAAVDFSFVFGQKGQLPSKKSRF